MVETFEMAKHKAKIRVTLTTTSNKEKYSANNPYSFELKSVMILF